MYLCSMLQRISFYFITFTLIVLGFSACKFSKLRKSTDLQEKYQAAMEYYEKKDYYKAGLLLEEVIPLIRGTAESEKAQFYYGYCHYHQKQYTLAAYYFQRFYEAFRGSAYIAEARYMHVKSLYADSAPYNLDQASTYDAINTAQSYLNAYPNSEYFEECNNIMNELRQKLERKAYENAYLYYKIRNYKAAVVSFNNFQRDFPDSGYNEDIAFLKLEAQYELASRSIDKRKKERYNEAISYYEYFVANFPESKSVKNAEKIYESILSEMDRMNTI